MHKHSLFLSIALLCSFPAFAGDGKSAAAAATASAAAMASAPTIVTAMTTAATAPACVAGTSSAAAAAAAASAAPAAAPQTKLEAQEALKKEELNMKQRIKAFEKEQRALFAAQHPALSKEALDDEFEDSLRPSQEENKLLGELDPNLYIPKHLPIDNSGTPGRSGKFVDYYESVRKRAEERYPLASEKDKLSLLKLLRHAQTYETIYHGWHLDEIEARMRNRFARQGITAQVGRPHHRVTEGNWINF